MIVHDNSSSCRLGNRMIGRLSPVSFIHDMKRSVHCVYSSDSQASLLRGGPELLVQVYSQALVMC